MYVNNPEKIHLSLFQENKNMSLEEGFIPIYEQKSHAEKIVKKYLFFHIFRNSIFLILKLVDLISK